MRTPLPPFYGTVTAEAEVNQSSQTTFFIGPDSQSLYCWPEILPSLKGKKTFCTNANPHLRSEIVYYEIDNILCLKYWD